MNVQGIRTRAQLLASEIEKDVFNHTYRAGDLIGTIDQLKERSGYARSTVAEAIRLLTDRGLAEVRPGRGGGLFATATSPVVRIRHTLLTVDDAPSSVADAVAVREALEPLIDVDAARFRTEADIEAMRRRLAALRSAASEDPSRFLGANWALHETIASITPNKTASALYLSMMRFVREHATAIEHDNEGSAHAWFAVRVEVHRELVEAIIAGDVPRVVAATAGHAGLLANS